MNKLLFKYYVHSDLTGLVIPSYLHRPSHVHTNTYLPHERPTKQRQSRLGDEKWEQREQPLYSLDCATCNKTLTLSA